MDTILPYALLCFTSFFTLTNPLGTMPVFLTMTNGLEEKERQHIVKRATIISFIILIAFTFLGGCLGCASVFGLDFIKHQGSSWPRRWKTEEEERMEAEGKEEVVA